MSCLELKAHAKINLSLDVLGKRDDGYHELRMIMQTIALHDTVLLEAVPDGIILECGSRWVPEDRTNTAWKAADLLKCKFGIKSGIKIRIIKRIPVAAGLAGGSSDAAAVLRGINELFSLGIGPADLRQFGKQVGADVPYCISGGTMLAEGIGEKLTALPDFSGVEVVLVKPRISVSTAWVYGNLRVSEIINRDRPDTELLSNALGMLDTRTIAENMKNVLESVTISRHDIVRQAKERLLELGALGSMMSGSGPTTFGIFPDGKSAAEAYDKLTGDKSWECFRTRTIGAIQ
jgi:4-diphosphocytidyl-2-C-methyl-D-erythritol kinase